MKRTYHKGLKMPKDYPFKVERAPTPPRARNDEPQLVVTAAIRGEAAEKFEELRKENGLNTTQLVRQMIFHCLDVDRDWRYP